MEKSYERVLGSVDLDRLLESIDETRPQVLSLLEREEVERLRRSGTKIFRILTRVSDDKLLSIPDQIRECLRYVHGEEVGGARRKDTTPGEVDRVYNFGTQSGFTLFESPLFQELLRECSDPLFDGFVARDSSRLGRDYWDKFATLGLLRRSGKELHIIEDGGFFDYEDDLTKVRSWADTWSDSKKKLEEIRKSLRATEAIRSEGYPTTSHPFGYRNGIQGRRKVWAIDPPKARIVRELFDRYRAEDPPPLSEVARELGISRQLARKILRNRAYTGGFTWRGEFHPCRPDVIPPLVSPEEFEAVQERLRRISRPRKGTS